MRKVDYALAQEFRRKIAAKVSLPVDVVCKTYSQLFEKEFVAREGVLSGGYSMVHKLTLASGFGYKTVVLFIYGLTKKTKSERMRFYYALYGRNSKGMLYELNAKKYTDTVILCPLNTSDAMREFPCIGSLTLLKFLRFYRNGLCDYLDSCLYSAIIFTPELVPIRTAIY